MNLLWLVASWGLTAASASVTAGVVLLGWLFRQSHPRSTQH